jgi:hypothetical protein
MTATSVSIPGYLKGSAQLARSPVTQDDLALLKKTLLMEEDDLSHLKLSREVVADQVEAILDVWYGFVGANAHLLDSFRDNATGEPDGAYLAAVRKRFGQWILDTAEARFDQAWLDWQHEIGLRHHRTKKNRTDNVRAAAHIPYRYMIALVYPITATLKPFLAKKGHPAETVEKMHAAWTKAVLLQAILWTWPYVKPGDF